LTRGSWNEPRTIVGKWLVAVILGERDLRDRLQQQLNGGVRRPWKFDEPGMVEVACELAIRRLLPLDADESRIAALAADMYSKSRADSVPSREVNEKVIRAALDRNVEFEGIDNATLFTAQAASVVYAYYALHMDEHTMIQLIADGERIAFERGWKPPLAE
jgi:hypothetical protein